VTKTEKGATFVALSLITSLAVGVCSALNWAGSNALSLLVATAFLTTAMAVLSGWIAVRTWREHQLLTSASNSPIPVQYVRRGIWHLLSRRQWNTLTLGLTAIVALTGTFAGVEVLQAQPTQAATQQSPQPRPVPTAVAVTPATSPALLGPTVDPSVDPSLTDSPTVEPSVGDSSSVDPTDDATPVPTPGMTGYLDSVQPVNGGYDSGPVMLSGHRYPRGLTMYCYRATDDYIEWNVAGYKTFKSTLGVADDASYAFGNIAEMIFYDQDGRQLGLYDVSLGHPKQATFSLVGVVHLRVTCSGRDAKTNHERSFRGALADAEILG